MTKHETVANAVVPLSRTLIDYFISSIYNGLYNIPFFIIVKLIYRYLKLVISIP